MEKTCVVQLEDGITSSKAAELIRLAVTFGGNVRLSKENRTVDAKSVLGVVSLSIQAGDTVTFAADGDDAENFLEQLIAFVS